MSQSVNRIAIDQPRSLNLGMNPLLLSSLVLILLLVFLLSLALGSVNIPLDQIVRVLLGGEADKRAWADIILKFRLPKALTAALAGAALGISGLMMQTFFRNPLADSFILGVNSGASLGVSLVVLASGTVGTTLIAGIGLSGDLALAAAASVGAGITLLVVLFIARRIHSPMTLLVLGLMFGYLTSALVSLMLYFAVPERTKVFINWSFGSFGGVTWGQMPIFAPAVLVGLALAFVMAKSLNALLLGETYARSMGLNVWRARLGIITATALLAGAVTAFCGPIAFIGVAVPHLCRSLFRASDHRVLVPSTLVMGAIVAQVAALLAQMPGSDLILPLNAVTSLIGAPVVIWVILRQRNTQKAFAG